MNRLALLVIAVGMAIGATMSARPAMAADPMAGFYVDPGICAEDRYLNRISRGFDHQVRNVPNLPLVDIVHFDRIRENRFLPQLPDRPIERRYCQAVVTLSDGNLRDVWYMIENRAAFAGTGQSVEFCVSGFDRWNVYGGRCRVLR